MADLSKIKLKGTTYNFKDAWARTNLQTATQVQNAITQALGDISGFEISIVQTLPATGDSGTFYFVANPQGAGNNIYNEYVYVGNTWEKIGSLDTGSIDLDGYLKTTDIAAWAKAANKPTYTASEVGAVATTAPAAAITNQDITNWNNKLSSAPVTSVNGQTGAVTVSTYDDTALAARVTALENTNWYRYYTGSSTPSNSTGNNGDLYFQTV